ncbi:hypothetical protein J1N09_15050 [Aureitalea sp. L0-47]|uniref:hypothetical protein n=1 Tax=Aureitalea sp. L0-47 TaxID=2816962 RepID=UPI002237478F|nr:hypothetical protein [Aureitalea sp. L0-47]MCW5521164.1 hypothetical protein [Aureitalea sp. L0-47]
MTIFAVFRVVTSVHFSFHSKYSVTLFAVFRVVTSVLFSFGKSLSDLICSIQSGHFGTIFLRKITQ